MSKVELKKKPKVRKPAKKKKKVPEVAFYDEYTDVRDDQDFKRWYGSMMGEEPEPGNFDELLPPLSSQVFSEDPVFEPLEMENETFDVPDFQEFLKSFSTYFP